MNKSAQTVRVFESVPGPGPIVKFIDELVRHAPTDISYSYFSWRSALFSRYDVFHVHWPEFLIRDRSRTRSLIKRVLFRALLAKLKHGNIPVIRTVHNVEPHSPGPMIEKKLLARLDRLCQTHVVMSTCTPTDWTGDTVLIPHGDFREPFAEFERSSRIRGRILLFGRIQPYKGVIELIRAAEDIRDPEVEVRIVGSPTPEMRQQIDSALAVENRKGAKVSVDLRSVSDAELVTEMTRAELVALPYRDAGNGNSGVAMVSLSLDRPVVVPRSCVMEHLAAETGPRWVQLMDDEISGPGLEAALAEVRSLTPDARPEFHGRDWPTVASSYAEVFRSVV